MLFTAISDSCTRNHWRFKMTSSDGALWEGVPIYRVVSSCDEGDVEFIRASIEMQGMFVGRPIPQVFQYSERDEGVLEPLCQFLRLDVSLGWTEHSTHNSLINCFPEAFWMEARRREDEMFEMYRPPVTWVLSGGDFRPVKPMPRGAPQTLGERLAARRQRPGKSG